MVGKIDESRLGRVLKVRFRISYVGNGEFWRVLWEELIRVDTRFRKSILIRGGWVVKLKIERFARRCCIGFIEGLKLRGV